MKKLVRKFDDFISDCSDMELSEYDLKKNRLFKMIKTHGEKCIRGREISNKMFEAKLKGENKVFLMIIEGRDSISVGRQMANKFSLNENVENAKYFKTKKGACVVIREKNI